MGDFLAYAGPQPEVRQPVDLRSLATETLQLFRNSPDFDRERHSVEIVSTSQSTRCLGNPDQLRQVLWNLLQNAIRAMPEGGSLRVELGATPTQSRLRLIDEGIGMSRAGKEKLFQPFHSGFQKGVGLGMAIVYQIIQLHKGQINVTTSEGQGTQVEILLPAATTLE